MPYTLQFHITITNLSRSDRQRTLVASLSELRTDKVSIWRNWNVNCWSQSGTNFNSFMDRIIYEIGHKIHIDRNIIVDCHQCLLGKVVIKSRSPLPGSQTRCCRAIVNHKWYSTGMHERIQGINRLDNTFVYDLWVWVAFLPQNLNLWTFTIEQSVLVLF